jgi:hypothetical protein
MEASPSPLSSRPKRTRISCHAAPDKTACAPFFKERRMMFASATNLYRKSGEAQWRDLCVDAPSWRCLSTGVAMGLRFTQGDERRLLSEATLPWKRRPHPCHLDRSVA